MNAPPRFPDGRFAPELVPKVPKHDGTAQDGRTYQFGNPGPSIGTMVSISTTFGAESPENEECTFIGTEGVARATRQAMHMVRFADAPWLMVQPISVMVKTPELSPWSWTLFDAHHRALFQVVGRGLGLWFGLHVESAYAKFHLKSAMEALARGELRFFMGGPCYIHCSPDRVEVQQLGRHDVVAPSDLDVQMEDNWFELVLRAPQFYEARFLMGEVPNRVLVQMVLKIMGAKVG